MRDLTEQWTSALWHKQVQAWIRAVLAEHSMQLAGPIRQPMVRFWSAHLQVPTDRGLYWFKTNSPAQTFEAGLLAALARLTPDRVVVPLASDAERGWLLSPDAGATLRTAGGGHEREWMDIVTGFASWQRELSTHGRSLLATGLPSLSARDAPALVHTAAAELADLPAGDPLHLEPSQIECIHRGQPLLNAAVEVLAATGIPDSLQHNDLHANNAFPPTSGTVRFFDFGDALWGHPFATLAVPIAALRRSGTDARALGRVRDAYLEVFTDLHPRSELLAVLGAALRLAHVHRYFAWRPIMAHAPIVELAEWGPKTTQWLIRATADDTAAL